jgi:hypothetical protein
MKGMTDVSGLREIRSLHSTGKRSIPRVQSSAYLDLYLLEKEKERLEKEAALLGKRSRAIRKRHDEIQRQTESLRTSASRPEDPLGAGEKAGKRNGLLKQWRTFPVNY